ncbi:MAG: tRNA (guanosine(37)-N1)-methyltransferase TrmD [Corynebacteriales bacterium]|nr:tRNA (guanosine(37)-N1)-methyltransferase TrmD [Mycobacteriales bacterium]
MRIDVVTIFPDYLRPLGQSLLGKASERGLVQIGVHDLRQWTQDAHRTVDDAPYGGGPGMVMQAEPWGQALDQIYKPGARLVVPTPAGRPFTQAVAAQLASEDHLIFACGRYEGIDYRVVEYAAERMPVDEFSIGDYVLAGGEAATLVMVEAITRLLPGVLGNAASAEEDSFSDGLLEGPAYTRPEIWRQQQVPQILLSGNHSAIAAWRRAQSLLRTADRRPELLELQSESLSKTDLRVLREAGFNVRERGVAQ